MLAAFFSLMGVLVLAALVKLLPGWTDLLVRYWQALQALLHGKPTEELNDRSKKDNKRT